MRLTFSNRPSRRLGQSAQSVSVSLGKLELEGELVVPQDTQGVVVFAPSGGASRGNTRKKFVAYALQQRGFATLLFDALTPEEHRLDARDERLRFDIGLLSRRLSEVTGWVREQPWAAGLGVGYFGSGTGVPAALSAAARRPDLVSAVVCRSGRPELAGSALGRLRTPTLLLVGSEDTAAIEQHELALQHVSSVRLALVPGGGHLLEEPGALALVSELAADWFDAHLGAPSRGLPLEAASPPLSHAGRT